MTFDCDQPDLRGKGEGKGKGKAKGKGKGKGKSKGKKTPPPILFLSSGETTLFTLTLISVIKLVSSKER